MDSGVQVEMEDPRPACVQAVQGHEIIPAAVPCVEGVNDEVEQQNLCRALNGKEKHIQMSWGGGNVSCVPCAVRIYSMSVTLRDGSVDEIYVSRRNSHLKDIGDVISDS